MCVCVWMWVQTLMQPVILAPNAPRTFLILQPQTSQTPRLLLSANAGTGQRLLFTIPKPGGGVQHVAMPANMVAISSAQLQQANGTGRSDYIIIHYLLDLSPDIRARYLSGDSSRGPWFNLKTPIPVTVGFCTQTEGLALVSVLLISSL